MKIHSISFARKAEELNSKIDYSQSDYVLMVCLKGCVKTAFQNGAYNLNMKSRAALLCQTRNVCRYLEADEDCLFLCIFFDCKSKQLDLLEQWLYFLSANFFFELKEFVEDYKNSLTCEIVSERLIIRLRYLLKLLVLREKRAIKMA